MTAPTRKDSAKVRILAVDDEVMNLELIQRSLRRRYQVLMAESAESALAILAGEPSIAVILTDFRMPGTNGAELLAAVMRTHPDTKRVIITGYADIDALSAAISSGQVHYVIKKPWKHPELHQLLDQLVDAYLLGRENRKLADSLRLVNDELRAKSGRAGDEPARSSADLPAPGGGGSPGQPSRAEPGHPVSEIIAYKDTLTGLYASGAFQEHVREEVARSLRHGQSVSLLIGDIDNFSAVNKELGYRSGDEVLCRIARMLTEEPGIRVRESDVAARYGGEEIALLLPETGKAGAMVKANRLREAIARIALPDDRRLTISFGIATVPDDAGTAHDLCRRAEAALRAAKHAGGDQVHTYGEVIEASEPSQPGALAARTGLAAIPVGEGMFRTYHECIGEIATLLLRSGSVACLYVDLGWLRRLALEAGPAYHADVYDRAGMALEELMSPVLEHGDLVCRADDAYVCVIAPKRHRPADASGLARLAIEIEGRLNHLLSADASRFLRDQPRVIVGQARILESALIRPDELVKRLLDEARNMADLRRKRAVLRDKALLQEVIVSRAITPVYQPIVALASGDLLGYEALARGPRQSPLESPSSLFRIAHEADLAFELDRICFAAALEHAQGFDPGHCLFVNVLPLMLYDTARLERTIATWLESAALGPHNLVFEISERSAIQSFSEFRRALAAYTSQGYRIAIDDVGTRHTDLETITALQPAYLKASEVVTRGAARSTVKREMLRSLAHIAAVNEAVIVAEGIETADDLAVLQELGIRYGQGYYLARPGPPFVRLPSSVKRALCGLAEAPRIPIAALSADDPVRAFAAAPGTYMMIESGVRDHETPTSAVSSPVAISPDRRDTTIMDQSPSSENGSSAPASAENPTDEDGVHN